MREHGGETEGLVRRVATTFQTIGDADAPATRRVVAAAKIAGIPAVAATATGIGIADLAAIFPGAAHLAVEQLGLGADALIFGLSPLGIGLAIGTMEALENRGGHSRPSAIHMQGLSLIRGVRTGGVIVSAAALTVAATLTGADAAGLVNAGGVAHGFLDAASMTAALTGATAALIPLWKVGVAAPVRQQQLGE